MSFASIQAVYGENVLGETGGLKAVCGFSHRKGADLEENAAVDLFIQHSVTKKEECFEKTMFQIFITNYLTFKALYPPTDSTDVSCIEAQAI